MEEWREIKNFSLYEISNLGRVRNKHSNRVMGLQILPSGYVTVRLCNNGNHTSFRVHRLVAQAFIPNPNNLPYINHKNEIKTDNRVENLEWCSAEYNSQYYHEARTTLYQYDLNGTLIKTWKSVKKASEELGLNGSSIGNACYGRTNTCGGFYWSHTPLKENDFKQRANKSGYIIEKYDLNNNLLKTYKSLLQAEKDSTHCAEFIRKCCVGLSNDKNFIWKFKY